MGVRGVTDLMMAPGLVNLDFADIRTVMAAMGKAMMGTGEAEGDNRAIRAAEAAINNPLLEDTSMSGARGLLINITGGDDLTLYEVDQAANRIREEVDEEAEIIFGSAIDETLQGKIRVSVVATGIDTPPGQQAQPPRLKVVGGEDHVAMAASLREPSFVPAGVAQAGVAQAGVAQAGFAPAGFSPAGYAAPGYAQAGLPVTQLRATASEQFAVEALEHGADAMTMPDGMAMQDVPPQRIEPVMTPAAPPRHQLGASPAAPSPTAPPRTGRTPSSTLFAPGQPMAASSRAADAPPPHHAAERPQSLFGRVTGVLGFRQAPEPELPARQAPAAAMEAAGEQMRPTVRQATPEDIGIGIPKFLLRQTSGVAAPRR
jgi:cell division protein FtsZ